MKASAISLLFLTSLLGACATTKPAVQPVPDGPTIEQAKAQQAANVSVRWGGEVVKVNNFSDHTMVEVIGRDLNKSGVPLKSDHSDGRFMARINSFIDPENIKPGREITVRGTLSEWQSGKIGEYDYIYPVLDVEEHKIWPKRRAYRSHYRHDPFWDPWYPSGYGSYFGRYYWRDHYWRDHYWRDYHRHELSTM